MSRYPGPDYRGPRDRSRSPPRFADRRASTASIFDGRPPGPPRTASDAPRGPRSSQFDAPRPPPPGGLGATSTSRPTYGSLRDAPPLQSGDRGRSYRDREYERRDTRPPSPRDRSPPRNFKESREYPARDLDIGRARRESRDGPPSAGSNYSDGQPFASTAPVRGGFTRGRGRGEFSFRGGRGGRANVDDRDLFRRDRSPQPRWGRDEREPARRADDRPFERREDERRASDWADRERDREREVDRSRRDQPQSRLEARRPSAESITANSTSQQTSQAPLINPARLAMIENSGADASVRRSSVHLEPPAARDSRRDPSETPSYLSGRVESTQNRYASRSSPPTQAVPVPAFGGAFAAAAPTSVPTSQSAQSSQPPKQVQESKPTTESVNLPVDEQPKVVEERKPDVPADAPTGPRAPPQGPKAQFASPPPAAPRAPRAYEADDVAPSSNRLHGVRSLESVSGPNSGPSAKPVAHSLSPAAAPALPTLIQPVSPNARFAELSAPTGPRASRVSPAHASVSPRPPAASPRSDMAGFQGVQRTQTPPPSAPSGPRNKSYSVSPKVASTVVPTAPKADRGPPIAPRGAERVQGPAGRAPDRLSAPTWAPPSAPKGQFGASQAWNQWRKPGPPPYADKTIPAKRDFLGEEKGRVSNQDQSATLRVNEFSNALKSDDREGRAPEVGDRRSSEKMDLDRPAPKRQPSLVDHGHSAAMSFFGKPAEEDDEDTAMSDAGQDASSSSEDEDSDMENDFNLTLFNAKFERQKRHLEAQFTDLSSRHYRSTTPLESIARLSRISTSDLQRVNEQRQRGVDLEGSPVTHHQRLLAPTAHSSDSGDGPDLHTPKGPDDHRVAIRRSDSSSEGIRRIRKPSLEPVNLPYLLKDAQSSFRESDAFQDTMNWQEDSKDELINEIEAVIMAEEDDGADVEAMFTEMYRKWREDCESLDRIREEQERLDRQQSLEPGPEADPPGLAPMIPVFEGRRLHKHSSEYEIEQVLKQSEETARIEQERQDREAKKNQADMEKEASVPDLLTEDEMRQETFIDTNTYRDPESLSLVFSYEPHPDNFTENEQNIFIAAFKETPKKWSEIASLLPGRSYEDCIRHYYTNKWDGRFRDNRTKKLKAGGRRGRGGGRGGRGARVGGIMADLVRAEDFLGPENMTEKGRPRRAAAPVTFAEKEEAAKASLLGQSPAKKTGASGSKVDSNGDVGSEKASSKRKKGTGEKPGRKPKANPPLAQLAAAPQASPGKQFLHSKEDLARGQRLEEASLLAGFQAGHHGMSGADGQMIYAQDSYMQAAPPADGSERSKVAGGGPAKQGASSYWSVPEQNDFVKYIHHFGRDFAAIAAHMGTKTQTMIKNHYQRQVDGGNRQDLEKFANEADERRARGDEMGPPPEPTPIVKRKYDNPPPQQRALAPQNEAMDIDDSGPNARSQPPKHTSPPQYQTQPRLTSSMQNTSIPAPRVEPSPLVSTASPAAPHMPTTTHQRQMQNPLGSRITFLPDTRTESRPLAQTVPGFRAAQEPVPQSQTAQNGHSAPNVRNPQYMRDLIEEQNRALQMQEREYIQQDRPDLYQRHNPLGRNLSQGSPLEQALHSQADRKLTLEERPSSPPRSTFPSSRPLFGSSNQFGPLGSAAFPTLSGRPFNPSPTKKEESRPGSVSAMGGIPPSAPPPEPKKQSNIMSLLNTEPDEPKPPKRESYATPSAGSPTAQTFSSASSGTNVPALRREPSFGQPSLPHSHFPGGGRFGQQSSTPAPAQPKHESPGSGPLSQSTKPPNWAAHVLGQTNQQSPPTPTLERDVRPYNTSHRSMLGSLGQQRANPSPPPLSGIPHSRTPSASAQIGQQQREQHRPSLSSQQQASSHQAAQPLQPNPYASQQPSQFSQPQSQPGQSQNHAHHSHNGSLNNPFPPIHHRVMSRDEFMRRDAAHRDREEQESIWNREAAEEKRRREEHYQRQQEHDRERERQQSLLRAGPPQPLSQPPFSSQFIGQSKGLDLREQSRMETEMAMREHERQREHERHQRMMRDREQADEYRRRSQEEQLFQRRTPLGGGFGAPPPAPRR